MAIKRKAIGFLIFLITISGNAMAGNTYNYANNCPANGGKGKIDAWQFYQCECVSYGADKLNEKGIAFNNNYKNVKWGSAINWINAAKAARISYNTSPKRGDIAWFSYGHVAYVDSVDSKGNVTLSEYNYSPPYGYKYSTRTVKKGSTSYPRYFIHL